MKRPAFYIGALDGWPPLGPHYALTAYIPMHAMVGCPRTGGPAAVLRWIADQVDQKGGDIITWENATPDPEGGFVPPDLKAVADGPYADILNAMAAKHRGKYVIKEDPR